MTDPSSLTPQPAALPSASAPAPAPKSSRGAVVALSIVAAIFFLAAGGAGGLYYVDHGKAQDTQAEQQAKIDDLQAQLDTTKGDLETAESDLTAAEETLDACKGSIQDFLDASIQSGGAISEAEAGTLLLAVLGACDITVDIS